MYLFEWQDASTDQLHVDVPWLAAIQQDVGISRDRFLPFLTAVFGKEHFLNVLNWIAEEPLRVYQALVDLLET